MCPQCCKAYETAYEKLNAELILCPSTECFGVVFRSEEETVDEKQKEDAQEIKLELLRPDDSDRKKLVDAFHASVNKSWGTVDKAFRVVNRPLQTIFEACKARMNKEGRKVKGAEVGANEKLLFHATSRAAAGGIVREGFDMRRAGEAHGTALGPGAYFAVEAATSLGYVKRDGHGGCSMLVCKVLVGEPKRDAVHTTNVFVVNREQQILPVYLLQLQPKGVL